MNRRLLDDVVGEIDKPQVDSEYIVDAFVDVCVEYLEETDDPTTEQIEVLLVHFADCDPDDLNEETLALLWVMRAILQWMVDDLPLRKQHSDPEWLREKADFYERIGMEDYSRDEEKIREEATKSRLKVLIDNISQENENAAPISEVCDRAEGIGIDSGEAETLLDSLLRTGEIIEQEEGCVRTV